MPKLPCCLATFRSNLILMFAVPVTNNSAMTDRKEPRRPPITRLHTPIPFSAMPTVAVFEINMLVTEVIAIGLKFISRCRLTHSCNAIKWPQNKAQG